MSLCLTHTTIVIINLLRLIVALRIRDDALDLLRLVEAFRLMLHFSRSPHDKTVWIVTTRLAVLMSLFWAIAACSHSILDQ